MSLMIHSFDEADTLSDMLDTAMASGSYDLPNYEDSDELEIPQKFITDLCPSAFLSSTVSESNDANDTVSINRSEWLITDSISNRPRSPRLYEFLILILKSFQYESYASFIDRAQGIFEIHQPGKVVQLWQQVKIRRSTRNMTYDKFARAIRWYYKSKIMLKTHTRFTFKFSSHIMDIYFMDENQETRT
jgi:hypothetical protein